MPDVELSVRWADGAEQHGHAPSRAIQRWLVEGASYPRDELVRRICAGLAECSDRVRERYGVACTAAAELERELVTGAGRHGGGPDTPAQVTRLRQIPPAVSYPAPERLPDEVPVVVVGAGQAGLTASWFLRQHDIEHLVLERERVAGTWRRQRWDTFCLVTPNWQCRLPGHAYAGPDSDGFMLRDEIIAYVRSFADSFGPPVCEGVTVRRIEPGQSGGFRVETDRGAVLAEQVVLAVGGYHVPRLPPLAAAFPDTLTQLHSSGYRNPSSLPDGAVLVVGSGQSGAQIAEDLQLAGRDVHVAVGSAPRVARFYRGRDCVAWLQDIGHYDLPIDEHPEGLAARREPNHYVTGRDGGHDIDLRAHACNGMTLHGRLAGIDGDCLTFAGDLADNLDAADATAERIKDTIDGWIDKQGVSAPTEARYEPVWTPRGDGSTPLHLTQAGLTTVLWATGFVSDWSWVDVPGLLDDGYPSHERGVTTVPGLFVLGLPWLYTWGSGRFAGITRDAEHVTAALAAQTVETRSCAVRPAP